MDFRVGGIWLYAIVSPEGQRYQVYAQSTAIETERAISSVGMFCEGDGNPIIEGPKSYRNTIFSCLEGHRTKIDMVTRFEKEFTLIPFVKGGFQEGIAMALALLDELIAS